MSHVIEFRGAMRPPRKSVAPGATPELPGLLEQTTRARAARVTMEAAEEAKTLSVRERHDATFDRPPRPSRIRLRRRWRDAVSAAFLFAALALVGVFNHLKD